jgi:predicted secreted protein
MAVTNEAIELHVGEEHRVRLPGLGTAGYAWEHSAPAAGPVAVVEAHEAEEAQHERDRPAGKSADQLFTIRALRPGKAAVTFRQRRPWEATAAPINEHIVDLDVS